MGSHRRWVMRVAVPAIAMWLGAGLLHAATSDTLRLAVNEMMSAARAMVDEGDRGASDRMAQEAERVVEAGERALDALPNPGNRHARDAAEHFREAVDQATLVIETVRRGQPDEALTHARRALSQIRRGAGHAEAL